MNSAETLLANPVTGMTLRILLPGEAAGGECPELRQAGAGPMR